MFEICGANPNMKRPAHDVSNRHTEQVDELWAGWSKVLHPRPGNDEGDTEPSRKHPRRFLKKSHSFPPYRRKTRSVHFAKSTRVLLVPTADEYTYEEKVAAWITARDVAACRCECTQVVQKIHRGEPIDESRMTARGLERHVSDAHLQERRKRKQDVVRAVLAQQHAQRNAGTVNPQSLRMASLRTSYMSTDLALAAAAWDKAAVEEPDLERLRSHDHW
eukprot:CAMPEP_0183320936 /NCGR_PEP_ID=MMETSP0160_2-20130417/67621_1 /TAXON_ID=2839 ORGANISM="Odontella Sinensis, Strain Grunow 1884" /NCGR_SAMPLE_ID=MMETSP0160_2 /ASSEMBLY_ACC=CAM_ASM_000250 /LENGTH=218 /DNA_ID=CAMNT_0025487745 /DNA_START=161 /DNA_END=814 /DNA_ORIENTATION=+